MGEVRAAEHELAVFTEVGLGVLTVGHETGRRGGGGIQARGLVLTFQRRKQTEFRLEGRAVDSTRLVPVGHGAQVVRADAETVAGTPAVGDADLTREGGADGTDEQESGRSDPTDEVFDHVVHVVKR